MTATPTSLKPTLKPFPILLCAPKWFDVEYEINPWMHVSCRPQSDLAWTQWRELENTFVNLGAVVCQIEPVKGLPDMVFTANGALIKDKRAYLASFTHPQRQGETAYFRQWFETKGYTVFESSAHRFEGEGDALFGGETLFCGVGFGSQPEVYPSIAEFLSVKQLVICEMVDPRFYHLDTCFCPINEEYAIWFPGAFSQKSQTAMRKAIKLIDVPEEEAKCFACNSVVIRKNIVMPQGANETRSKLEALGFTVTQLDMSEFMKSGGAVKCLSLKLGSADVSSKQKP